MMLKRFLLIALFLLLPFPAVAEEAALSLTDVLNLADRKNEQIRMAEERLYQSEKDKTKAFSAILPTLTLEGSYTRAPEKLGGIGVIQSKENYNLQARLNQSLFTGGKLRSGLRIAEGGIRISREARDIVREDLLFQTAQVFYNVLKEQESVAVEKRNVSRLEAHLRQARVRFEVGDVTRSVVFRAEAEYAAGQAVLTQEENALSVFQARLAVLAGLPEGFALQRPESLPVGGGSLEVAPEEALKKNAMKNRPDLLRKEAEETVAKDRVTYTRGDLFPFLSLEGIYFYRGQDPESPFFLDRSWSVALKLDYPLFDGGLRRADLQQKKSSLRETRLARQQLEKDTEVEVHNTLLNLKAAEQILQSRNKQTTFAKENFEMVSKQFEHGLATNVDVLDANSLLSQSERDQIHAGIERDMAILSLQKAAGVFLKNIGIGQGP
jgi:outer membrane protein